MEHKKIRIHDNQFGRREQTLKTVESYSCPACGALMYQGPKPTFRRISCPRCRKIWEVKP